MKLNNTKRDSGETVTSAAIIKKVMKQMAAKKLKANFGKNTEEKSAVEESANVTS